MSIKDILKKRVRNLASNYRLVSSNSLCCKLQEHIIASNIMKHLDQNKILIDCLHGFRAKHSCETHLLTLFHDLVSTLNKGN